MLENQQISKAKPIQQHSFRPFSPINSNTSLRGNTKQLDKYQFSFDQKLGSGLTSDAYIGIQKATQKLVCVKIIDREIFKDQTQKALLANEIKCQQKLDSDYIIRIFDVYDTNSFCFVVTELCEDGDLFKLIRYSRIGLPQSLVVKLGHNLAQALLKMKETKIIHRDIKSENILLKQGIAKLGDFGFAIEEKDIKERQFYNIGSPLYMSLESLEQNKYSYESDIFSFGVVLYEMLHGQSPWQCSDEKQLIHKIKTEKVTYKSGVSERLQKLIDSCLEKTPQKRAKIERIYQQLEQMVCIQKHYEHKIQLQQQIKVQA